MPERLSARAMLDLVTDEGTFTELPYPVRESDPNGPLSWQGYDASRARAAERTGERESVVCGTASVEGTRAVLIAFEFGFLGGSLGEGTGDRLEAAYTHAREHRLPVVPLVATGGSRMQEGMLALTQLQRVARQSVLTREAGLPQIAVLRDPTTGGGWATLGAGADVILALPGAQIGFAGSRVRPPDADPTAYTAEAQVTAGAADAVVPPAELRGVLGLWLRLLAGAPAPRGPQPGPPGPSVAPDATAAHDTPSAARTADSPGTAGTSGTPDASGAHGTPGAASAAASPGTATTSGTPGAPGTPGPSAAHGTPGAAGAADSPDTAGTSAAFAASGTPGPSRAHGTPDAADPANSPSTATPSATPAPSGAHGTPGAADAADSPATMTTSGTTAASGTASASGASDASGAAGASATPAAHGTPGAARPTDSPGTATTSGASATGAGGEARAARPLAPAAVAPETAAAPPPTRVEPAPVPAALGVTGLPRTGWAAVRRARSPERPRAQAYLDAWFTRRVALSGDRCGGSDPDGMLCGFGERDGRTVAYAAQTGTATRPAGYRTAARLIRLADRLGIPVLTLVDTPGAANDAEAERQGAGAAIADLFGAVAAARVPVTTLVVGEGGSGGALALAAPGNTWATPDSYFSVIAPELAAAILKRPPEEVEATAEQLCIRPQDLLQLGVIRGIADHPEGGSGDRAGRLPPQ